MTPIFHIARASDWKQAMAAGEYRMSTLDRTLDDEGFIHCSFREQVAGVARAFYRDVPDLVLLEIDPSRLHAEVRIEPVADSPSEFPHVYGPLNVDAVVAVRPFDPTTP